jgi:hypothetical protein
MPIIGRTLNKVKENIFLMIRMIDNNRSNTKMPVILIKRPRILGRAF